MVKRLLSCLGILVLATVVYFAFSNEGSNNGDIDWDAPLGGIVDEKFETEAGQLRMELSARVDSSPDEVWATFHEPERSAEFSETVRISRLLDERGNQKTVLFEMEMFGQLQRLVMEFTFLEQEKRLMIQSIESQFSGVQGEYRLASSPDGESTLITYAGTLTNKAGLPIPLSLQKRAATETFLSTVQSLKQGLLADK